MNRDKVAVIKSTKEESAARLRTSHLYLATGLVNKALNFFLLNQSPIKMGVGKVPGQTERAIITNQGR